MYKYVWPRSFNSQGRIIYVLVMELKEDTIVPFWLERKAFTFREARYLWRKAGVVCYAIGYRPLFLLLSWRCQLKEQVRVGWHFTVSPFLFHPLWKVENMSLNILIQDNHCVECFNSMVYMFLILLNDASYPFNTWTADVALFVTRAGIC